MWVFFQNGNTEYNDFYSISIIVPPLFLNAQSKLKYTFFPKYQLVIGKNGKIYKRVWALFLYMQVPGLKQPVQVCIWKTDWLGDTFPLLSYILIGFGLHPSGSSCGTSAHK